MPGDRLIQDGGINQLLQRRFNIDAAPAVAFAPEVFPIIPAAVYSQEFDRLAGIKRCGASATVPTGAATLAGLHIRNPANSGVLVMLDQILFSPNSGGVNVDFGIVPNGADLDTVASSIPLDTRDPISATTRLTNAVVSVNAAGAALPATFRSFCQLNSTTANTLLPLGIVLRPGDVAAFYITTVNQGWKGGLFWRERRAQPAEL